MPLETEIKLRVPDEHAARRLTEDPRVCESIMTDFADTAMEAVYYDTQAGTLQERQWAFRIRQEDGVAVACCKTSESKQGALFSRREWQAPGAPAETALNRLVEAGAPEELLRCGEMRELCTIAFTRTAAPLRLSDETHVEMAIDVGHLIAGDKKEAFIELELELLAGDVGEMQEFSEYLEKQHTLTAEHSSKYERALRLIRSRG